MKLPLRITILLLGVAAFTQGQTALSTIMPSDLKPLNITEVPTFDHDVLLLEDTRIEEEGGRTNHGRIAEINLNCTQDGVWSTMPNGDSVWQLRVKTEGAIAVSAFFSQLALPVGSTLILYPIDRSYYVGPYTHEDCIPEGIFATSEVLGDDAILEYYQPASVVGTAKIAIRGIGHFYRNIYDFRDENSERGGGSAACEVDINCPEGDDWQQERDAVVRLTLVEGNFIGNCTGRLVNNTALDCKKYILTALHCAVDASASDLLSSSVTFGYQRSGCGTGAASTVKTKTGLVRRADSNDNGGDSGSDFLLMEMDDPIPASWNPFWAGWESSSTAPGACIGIHHPAGDAKKISTTNANTYSGSWGASGTHWGVEWIATESGWGVTEGGSSGSPLFNMNHRIVGTLTGGGSCCTTNGCGPGTSPTADDSYGKMNRHWTSNPNAANQKLKVWLDPGNTGITSLGGSYNNIGSACTPALAIEELLNFSDIQLYPNLASNYVNIYSEKYQRITEIRMFDSAGLLIRSFNMNTDKIEVDLSGTPNGLYYFSFIESGGNHVTKKLTVIH